MVLRLIHQLSEDQPVLLSIEDLHWADPSTLELLDLLIEQASEEKEIAKDGSA